METIFFNLLPVKGLQLVFKNKFLIIFIVSLIFSILHTYSLSYMFMTFVGGVLLNTYFIISDVKFGWKKASLYTALLHSTYNLIGFLILEVFHVF